MIKITKKMLTRTLGLILILAMLFSCVACGRATPGGDSENANDNPSVSEESTPAEESSEPAASTEEVASDGNSDAKASDGNAFEDMKYEKGSELSSFITQYSEAKSVMLDQMTNKIDESGDLSLTMSLFGFAMADLTIAFVPLFDVVDEMGVVPMLNLKNAYRKEKGDLITFGADFIEEEETQGNTQKDDRVFWEGKLDVKDDSLQTIYYTERGGKKISYTLIEITKNKDKSFTSEMITYTLNEDTTEKVFGYFVNFDEKTMQVLSGDMENPKVDFNYVSVFNQKNVDLKSLTPGFKLTTDITFADGKVTSNIKTE